MANSNEDSNYENEQMQEDNNFLNKPVIIDTKEKQDNESGSSSSSDGFLNKIRKLTTSQSSVNSFSWHCLN